MTSKWLAERDVLKEQLSDLQTRNDNLQTSLVNRDVAIEKLVRMCEENIPVFADVFLQVMYARYVSISERQYITTSSVT